MLKQIWQLVKKMFAIFLGKDGDAKKTATAAVFYRLVQWGLVAITLSIVTTVKVMNPELGFTYFFLPLWIANIVVVAIVLTIRSKSAVDFTLMEGVRNVLTEAFALSLVAGILLESLAFLYLLIYSGADNLYVFFESRLSSNFSRVAIVLFASFCNMYIWVSVFYAGASGLIAFAKMLYA
jgi:hypothetical protein